MAEKIAPQLFNGVLESATRTTIFLDAAYPGIFDLLHLTWFDHLVVHTSDIGGPQSLHPDIPQRTGELLVRRTLVEDGLRLGRRLHLIDDVLTAAGVFYRASDEAAAFVESLRSDYARELKSRALWLAQFAASMHGDALERMISDRIGQWAVEFQGETSVAQNG
jgi:hypothetical protein